MKILFLSAAFFASAFAALADDGATARPDPPVLKALTSDFPTGDKLEYRVMTATLPPGAFSPWHTHPAPVAVYVEKGVFTLERKNGSPVSIKAGEALLEPIDLEVRAANHGSEPAKVVIFQVSDPKDVFLKPAK